MSWQLRASFCVFWYLNYVELMLKVWGWYSMVHSSVEVLCCSCLTCSQMTANPPQLRISFIYCTHNRIHCSSCCTHSMFTRTHAALKSREESVLMAVEQYPIWVILLLFYFVRSVLFYVESSAIYNELNITCLKTKVVVKVSVCSVYVCVFPWPIVSQEMLQIVSHPVQLPISVCAKHTCTFYISNGHPLGTE